MKMKVFVSNVSGSTPTKAIRMLTSINVCCISTRTFFRHQATVLIPAINSRWEGEQQRLCRQLAGAPLTLGGDGRADSPGHCAKFGTYTLLDLKSNLIVDTQVVQVMHKHITFKYRSKSELSHFKQPNSRFQNSYQSTKKSK